MPQAEKAFVNGNVMTMNPSQPAAEAVATLGDKILAVGSRSDIETLIGAKTKIIDLSGKTMIPGFNDGHGHLLQFGLDSLNLEVTPEICDSMSKLKKLVAARAAKTRPGEWIQGWGWDESRMEGGLAPSVDDLTEAAPHNPVILIRTCYHVIAVNKMALDLAGVTDQTPDPAGGKIVRDIAGRATGILQDTAQTLVKSVVPPPSKEALKDAIKLASEILNKNGVTSITDAGMLTEVEGEIPAWCEAARDGLLTVRTTALMLPGIAEQVRALGLTGNFGNDLFKFGSVKFFMDGSVGGGTAGMTKPYLNPAFGVGLIYMEQEEISAKIKEAHDAGYQVAVHGIGDKAIDMILTAFEEALKANPRKDHRHRIEHFSMSYPHLLDRAKAMNITASMNPGFLYFLGISQIANIGDEVFHEFSMKSALDRDILISAGSDAPVINPHPRYGLFSAVWRKTISGLSCGEAERISMHEALRAYTASGAYQTFDEKKKGSIEPCKYADFAVLSVDPTKAEPQEVLEMETLMTVLGGEVVHSV
ncbi:MAG: amidohydrolase [Clostridiales Family XIII bacterium]|jgi:predicted amidohydrolase YtcJ|nr:amidohydrolase [Clostridiales Family XIII bacterium]